MSAVPVGEAGLTPATGAASLQARRDGLRHRSVQTVLGRVSADRLGLVLPHEHLFSDLNGYGIDDEEFSAQPIQMSNHFELRLGKAHADDWRLDDSGVAIDEALIFKQHGGGTIVDASSRGLGRDPRGLTQVAKHSGLHVVMGCGWYIASFHEPRVQSMSVEEIAAEIVADATIGADQTGVKAGIIGEIGMSWPPHPDEEKVLRAAAQAQQETGLAILLHPGRDPDAIADHLRVLAAEGADLTRTIVCHVDRTISDVDEMSRIAEQSGAVLEFDLFGDESSHYPSNPDFDRPNDGMRVRSIRLLVDRGLTDQIVISQDICRKTRLVRWGGSGYAHIARRIIPLMAARGIPADAIEVITRVRPAELLSVPDPVLERSQQ